MRRAFLMVAVFAFGFPAYAGMAVEVESTANDSVGQRLVYFIKEGIRSSSSLSISFEDKPRLRLNLVTLDPTSNNIGVSTVYSAVINWVNPAEAFPFYLNQYVGTCSSDKVHECSESIIAAISEQADIITRALVSSKK